MSKIKKHFTSRFEDGWIVEADFSQLEIICLAQLSQDKQLIDDILSGRDMHCVRAAELFNEPEASFVAQYNDKNPIRVYQRKLAKALSFQLQYGSGARNMAKTNKVAQQTAQNFIDNYYNRYPAVREWQRRVAAEVEKSRIWDGVRRTDSGLPAGTGQYKSVTGRIYTFYEYDGWKKGQVSFKPTQMKNYPVQGLAADIVGLVLGLIYRALANADIFDDFLMVNTVHDSIIFDSKDESLDEGIEIVQSIMENAPKYMKETFGIDFFTDKMKVDVEIGRNWMEITKYE